MGHTWDKALLIRPLPSDRLGIIFLPFQFQKTKLYLTKQMLHKNAFGVRPNSHKSAILTT